MFKVDNLHNRQDQMLFISVIYNKDIIFEIVDNINE